MSPNLTEQQWLLMSSRITERLCALPAVATPDWCDRAARCLVPLVDRAVVGVILATLDASGAIGEREAVGAAVDAPTEAYAEGHVPNVVRSRADRLAALGFGLSAGALERGFCGNAERYTQPGDWRHGVLGRMWSEVATGDLLVAGVGLSPETPGRCLIVMVARSEPIASMVEREAVLRVVLPLLSRRALLAIGPTRTTTSDWLTSKEQHILERLTLGLSVADIAQELERSAHTVHDHVKSLHKKLGASSRGELISRALGHITEAKPRPARKSKKAKAEQEAEAKPVAKEAAGKARNGAGAAADE
ncbi:MAG: helix-turn-helix transcriptional regulator [Phycisphaerales bacterium]